MVKSLNIAIIGSGLTGLLTALHLQSFAKVTLFEKARGVGGRLSTRYSGEYEFDHGAPYFQVHDPLFLQSVNKWQKERVIDSWHPRVLQDNVIHAQDTYYLGVPKMNALPKYLARDKNILLNTEISSIQLDGDIYELQDKQLNTYGPFDGVISTAPFLQTKRLFDNHLSLEMVTIEPCYALMLGYARNFCMDWDIQKITDGYFSEIVINHQKPGRKSAPSVVVYSNPKWTQTVIDKDLTWIKSTMLEFLKTYIPLEPAHVDIHLWRYARSAIAGNDIIFDARKRLVAGGDWAISGGVEGAFKASQRIVETIKRIFFYDKTL